MAFVNSPHAPVNSRRPEPPGICDRCGARWLLRRLPFQFDWVGNSLQNLGLRVCRRCYDVPNEQNRPSIVGPDPVPLVSPRPYFYESQMQGDGGFGADLQHLYLTDENGVPIRDENGNYIYLE